MAFGRAHSVRSSHTKLLLARRDPPASGSSRHLLLRSNRVASGAKRTSTSVHHATALATPADALDLLVEERVFLVHGIVRVGEVLLVWHVALARLTMADRRLGYAAILRHGRTPAALRHRRRRADRHQERHRDHYFLHVAPPVPENVARRAVTSGLWRVEMNVAAVVGDTIARFFAFFT